MEPFIGQIIMFGGSFAPRGWALCDGQLLAISQNDALFSIIGTTYGGDGRTTFALPDLRGRVPMHEGSGPGLSPRPLGQKFGAQTNTLNVNNLPSHNHTASGRINLGTPPGNTKQPVDNFLSQPVRETIYSDVQAAWAMNPNSVAVTVDNTGNNQSINNMQPAQVVNFIIATVGIFPSRK